MKGKLIKTEEGLYNLKFNNDEDMMKCSLGLLSLKNCQAIERGYDLDELAKNEYRNFPSKANGEASLPRWGEDQHATKKQKAYKKGFMKALELMGDKRFTERDVRGAYIQGTNDGAQFESMRDYDSEDDNEPWEFAEEAEKEFTQSLQQKEWDVEIVMERSKFIVDKSLRSDVNNGFNYTPKLDVDGCLILKEIEL